MTPSTDTGSPDRVPNMSVLDSPPATTPSIEHPSPFFVEITANEGETSRVVEHVSNVHFLRWLDRGAELHLDSAGWTRSDLLSRGLMWFVARHEIDYIAEVLPGDQLYMATWVRDLRRVKSWRDSVLWRIEDDEPRIVCTASTLWVLVLLETRRPCTVPADMAAALEPLHPGKART
ncbi:MAG: acyl-CoA thioesterase [Planctomycetota bacterium]|nr:acyl-CoA thioesterase [Planctomycetota bacterium]